MSSEPTVLGGRYELGERLGAGGMATVYRGTDRVLGRAVAVKVLAPAYADDEAFVARFRREARAAARLNHPGVVSVFDTGSDDGTHYIVMELVAGRTLADVIARDGPLEPGRAAQVIGQVAAALSFAHENGFVHRDIKPTNIMITPSGDAKLMDFGIARATTDDTLTKTAFVMGTATYLSPEQAEGRKVDARSDIYSLGVVLYEALAGRPPFTADSAVAVATKHVREEPEPVSRVNPEVPAGLGAVAMRALAKDPDDRYQTADEMRADLERARTGGAVPAATDPLPLDRTAVLPPVIRTESRSRAPVIVAVLIGLAVLGAILAAVFTAGGSDNAAARRHSPPVHTTPPSSPTTSPSVEEPATASEAVGSLAQVLSQGLADGLIDHHAYEDLQHQLDDVTKELSEDPEKAADKVSELQDKVSEFVDKGEIDPSIAQRVQQAVQVLAAAVGGSDEGGGD